MALRREKSGVCLKSKVDCSSKDVKSENFQSSLEKLRADGTREEETSAVDGVADFGLTPHHSRNFQPTLHFVSAHENTEAAVSASFSTGSDQCIDNTVVPVTDSARRHITANEGTVPDFYEKRKEEEKDSAVDAFRDTDTMETLFSSLQSSVGRNRDDERLLTSDTGNFPKGAPAALLPYRTFGKSSMRSSKGTNPAQRNKEVQHRGGFVESYYAPDVEKATTDTEDFARIARKKSAQEFSEGTSIDDSSTNSREDGVHGIVQCSTVQGKSILESVGSNALACFSPNVQVQTDADLSLSPTSECSVHSNISRDIVRDLSDEAEAAFRLSGASAAEESSIDDVAANTGALDELSLSRPGNDILDFIPIVRCEHGCEVVGKAPATKRGESGNNPKSSGPLLVACDSKRRSRADHGQGQRAGDTSHLETEARIREPSVSFQSPVVTSVRTRPRTSSPEISSLFYVEEELQHLGFTEEDDDSDSVSVASF